MKYFKVSASRIAPRYEITTENYMEVTECKYPFEQKTGRGKLSEYAICPSCLNPIQLIGIMSKVNISPHGRHTGKDIDGLPRWQFEKYKYCPFRSSNQEGKKPNDDEKAMEFDNNFWELYYLLKAQFDRVVTIVSNELSIRCGNGFWEKSLQQFTHRDVFCYPWLTEVNLPYIFAYRGMQHQNVWGQKVLIGSELYNALKAHPNVKLEEYAIKDSMENTSAKYAKVVNNGKNLNLEFRFTNHKQKAEKGKELRESMLFCIDDLDTGETVFEKTIEFSENYFMNLIAKQGNKANRKQWLLDIADKVMEPVGKENT